MMCDGTEHEPIFAKRQIEDICNVWTYSVDGRETVDETASMLTNNRSNEL